MRVCRFLSDLCNHICALWPIWLAVLLAVAAGSRLFYWRERKVNPEVGTGWRAWSQCLYFTLICCTTIGLGDIRPRSAAGKVMTVLFGFIGLLVFGILVAIILRSLEGNIQTN